LTDNTRMCTGCGRQISTDYNVCPHCGRPQNQSYGPAPSPQPYGQPQQQYESLGALKYVLYVLSFLSLLIGIVIFLIWMNDPNPEKKRVGKNCLFISLAAILLSIICWGVLAAMSVALV
jgi:hypothetical protein